jgi:major membrane immunogen (membrane-anchored lipoprotein)
MEVARMKTKRFKKIALFLSTILVFSFLFTACGEKEDADMPQDAGTEQQQDANDVDNTEDLEDTEDEDAEDAEDEDEDADAEDDASDDEDTDSED